VTRLALSTLCESPGRRTGLTTLFQELVWKARQQFPSVEWDVFAPQGGGFVAGEGVAMHELSAASQHQVARVAMDHLWVPFAAKQRGCSALITVGFTPFGPLPNAVHILTMHHLDAQNGVTGLRAAYRRQATDNALRKARLVITNSQTAADELRRYYPAVEKRLLVSYEGVQHETFHRESAPGEAESLYAALGLLPGYILWVSNFYPYKQLDLMIKAYARLDADVRQRHPLVLVGGDWAGTKAAALELAETLGVTGQIKMLGWVDDRWIAPLYRHAALHCLASRAETFGRSVLEAMASGTPCVVNDLPIMREVTAGAAVVVDYRDSAATASAIEHTLTDQTARQVLIERGLLRAQEFSMHRLVRERMEAILTRVI
jgi:glycosyltransferase involved in cell wall biosynthesis